MSVDQKERSPLARLCEVAEKLRTGGAINQYAALCFRPRDLGDSEIEILLITSRDSGRWVIPKGWSMPKKKPHQVARQEAWEEAGVRGQVRKKPFGYYTYAKKIGRGELVPSVVQVHLMNVSALEEDFPEKGQRQLRWFSPTDAVRAVDEFELRGLFMNLSRDEEIRQFGQMQT
ncbi:MULTISPECIES: NUDIX hydrolase [Rhizobium/Agrobacterium group]|uniref:NUDIX hydrolase n=1 Tax=Rhizobium/Agrobacterium group TaxID=227290 RepID=UPI0004D9F230|nr:MULTISPECIES: NUDIX hydrolase [Rhizobium/Agrobacterium group]KEA02987.1 DNA mismatch repair protein MutT [Rhizobium rhizogenes]NTI39022.1 NUDIX hydrolase [Rhizobium rhizogenes]NTI85206.1 NUDIX hydrolase [Rhizobium rhizogenes]NTJ27392.1 NUDIX hydrolase [Rhizobium rhizogenes]QUE84814.1 NUDIX hydrolase [Rhizobium rhizogenes]